MAQSTDLARLRRLVDAARDDIVALAQTALQQRSMSGAESSLADIIETMMGRERVETWRDAVGNVFARIPGAGGPSTMLHAHMDVVDPGDESAWRHPPFAGVLDDGYLWGRGSVDTKGSLVAQVAAVELIARHGLRPAGDVLLAAVVGEETGGYGSRHLTRTFKPEIGMAIIGEPSGNTLRRGHRGRYEFMLTLHGRSAHASAPNLGRNPHYSMARFLLALRQAPMVADDVLPSSSVVPTLMYVDQTSSNVIPAALTVHLDWRAAPADTSETARAKIDRLLEECLEEDISAEVAIRHRKAQSYTGADVEVLHDLRGFCVPLDDPQLVRAHHALETALGHSVPIDVWTFCTDGGILAAHGVPCLGFGPGDDTMAHVLDERLAVEDLIEATAGYMALALTMGDA